MLGGGVIKVMSHIDPAAPVFFVIQDSQFLFLLCRDSIKSLENIKYAKWSIKYLLYLKRYLEMQ